MEGVFIYLTKIVKIFMKFNSQKSKRGFIALITVLLVSISTLLVASTLIYLSGSESLQGFQSVESLATLQIGDGCIEEALFRLKNTATYSGSSISIGNGSCDVTLIGSGGNGSTREITSSSSIITSIGNFTRRITASSTITTNAAGIATTTDITRWRE